jgi:hypothetical protein
MNDASNIAPECITDGPNPGCRAKHLLEIFEEDFHVEREEAAPTRVAHPLCF